MTMARPTTTDLALVQLVDRYLERVYRYLRNLARDEGGFRVEVDFVVPEAPRESLGLTLKTIRKGAARQQGAAWSYTFNVGFNEDRYLTRKIELPPGAEITETYRGSRGVRISKKTILLSQRYFPAETTDPLTVIYQLP